MRFCTLEVTRLLLTRELPFSQSNATYLTLDLTLSSTFTCHRQTHVHLIIIGLNLAQSSIISATFKGLWLPLKG